MRLVSNKESVARGEVSILAIVETLLAIALVFYLSAHFNTLRWLAVAMCVSPLLLLRTEESTRLGIEWFDRIWHWNEFSIGRDYDLLTSDRIPEQPEPPKSLGGLLFSVIEAPICVAIPPMVRVLSTTIALIHNPLTVVKAIPRNWFRVTLTIDSAFPPEIIPDHPRLSVRRTTDRIREASRDSLSLAIVIECTVFISFFLPSILYRWSLKATSIIYAPLIFVAHSTFSEGADLRTKLELIKRGDLSRIRVWYGVIAIAAFLVKLVLMMNLPGFADWWNGHPVSQFLALYIAPAEIPKWQLAELANSALAIGAMLFARHALLRDELKHPLPEAPVKRLLGFVSGLRWVLALYAILCTGYITMRAAQHWHWPALGEQWIPWQ